MLFFSSLLFLVTFVLIKCNKYKQCSTICMIECVNVKSTCLFRIDNKCEHTLKEIYKGKFRNEKILML